MNRKLIPPASAQCFIICGSHDGNVYCLNGNDGSLVWKLLLGSPIHSSPAFAIPLPMVNSNHNNEENGDTYLATPLCCVCSTTGVIFLIDFQGGQVVAQCQLSGEIFSSPVVFCQKQQLGEQQEQLIGNIIVGCRDNHLYCLEYAASIE
jgi:acyl-CoA synthetase